MVLDAVNNRPKKLRARVEPMTSRQNCVLSVRSRRFDRLGKQLHGALAHQYLTTNLEQLTIIDYLVNPMRERILEATSYYGCVT